MGQIVYHRTFVVQESYEPCHALDCKPHVMPWVRSCVIVHSLYKSFNAVRHIVYPIAMRSTRC